MLHFLFASQIDECIFVEFKPEKLNSNADKTVVARTTISGRAARHVGQQFCSGKHMLLINLF